MELTASKTNNELSILLMAKKVFKKKDSQRIKNKLNNPNIISNKLTIK